MKNVDLKKLLPSSFDIIGSKEKAVAIVEIPKELKSKKVLIAKELMKSNKNIKSVLMKKSERKGKLRLREHELLTGDKNTEVIHKEYGYMLKLDPQKVYFSPREATERQRIAGQVKKDETVLVMFSGTAAYPIAIAKKQPEVKRIYAIELNKVAHRYAIENVRINKLAHKIIPVLGDARNVCKNWYTECDRVIMPLPLGSEGFLDIAVNCLKRNSVIHFYNWGEERNLFGNALKLIDDNLKSLKKKYEIISKKKVLAYGPRKWKVCIDFRVK